MLRSFLVFMDYRRKKRRVIFSEGTPAAHNRQRCTSLSHILYDSPLFVGIVGILSSLLIDFVPPSSFGFSFLPFIVIQKPESGSMRPPVIMIIQLRIQPTPILNNFLRFVNTFTSSNLLLIIFRLMGSFFFFFFF